MPKDKEIVFVSGQKPILAKKLFYYMVPFFQQRVSETQVTEGNRTRYVPNKKYPPADEYSMKSDSCTVVDSYVNLLPKETKSLKDFVGAAKINKAVKKPKLSTVKDKIQHLLGNVLALIGTKKKTVKKALTKDEIKQRIKPENDLPQMPSAADFDIAEIQKGNDEIMDKEPNTAEDKDIMEMLKGHNATIDTGFDDLVAVPNPTNEPKSETEKTDIDGNEPEKFDKTFDDEEKPTSITDNEQKTEEKFSEGFDEDISAEETAVPQENEKTSEINIAEVELEEIINSKPNNDVIEPDDVDNNKAVEKSVATDNEDIPEVEKAIANEDKQVEVAVIDSNEATKETVTTDNEDISEPIKVVKNEVVQKTEPIKKTAPKKVIRRKFIKRKQTPSVSDGEKQMLEILSSAGITTPDELKLYLAISVINEEDIKEKIATYQKELEDLYELYSELEVA